MEEEGLGNLLSTTIIHRHTSDPLNSQVMYETDLAFYASYEDGTSASRELVTLSI